MPLCKSIYLGTPINRRSSGFWQIREEAFGDTHNLRLRIKGKPMVLVWLELWVSRIYKRRDRVELISWKRRNQFMNDECPECRIFRKVRRG